MEKYADVGPIAVGTPRRGRSSGPVAGWRGYRERRSARRAADAEILDSAQPSATVAWRVAELTAPKNRLALGHCVRRLVRSADASYLPGATPLNRIAVREEGETLTALADRVSDLDEPVAARGVLLLDRLLTDGYGPLYVSYRAGELRSTLATIAQRLGPS